MTDWDRRYREGEHARDEPHPLVTGFAAKLTPGFGLDVACGAGRHAIWLAERGWQVTAVDSSRVAIEILEQRASEKGLAVNTVLADLERHEFVIEPESYELIVVCNYLQRDHCHGRSRSEYPIHEPSLPFEPRRTTRSVSRMGIDPRL